MSSNLRTPTAQVRGLGASRSGTNHYIKQRVSAIGLVFLIPWFVISGLISVKGGYASFMDWLSGPVNVFLLMATLGAALYHMRLGVQTVIEDYISKVGTRQALLIANTFFVIGVFAVAVLAVLHIWLTAR